MATYWDICIKQLLLKRWTLCTGLWVLYCGSNGTTSAHFKSKTINSYLSLGLSVDNIDLTSEITSANVISKIVQLIDQYHLLLVEEALMLTPVTLARIDLRLQGYLGKSPRGGGAFFHLFFSAKQQKKKPHPPGAFREFVD